MDLPVGPQSPSGERLIQRRECRFEIAECGEDAGAFGPMFAEQVRPRELREGVRGSTRVGSLVLVWPRKSPNHPWYSGDLGTSHASAP